MMEDDGRVTPGEAGDVSVVVVGGGGGGCGQQSREIESRSQQTGTGGYCQGRSAIPSQIVAKGGEGAAN